MAKRGENIYLRKDGRYEGRYIKGRKSDGRPIFGSIYARRYAEVKCRLTKIKSSLYGERTALKVYGSGAVGDFLEFHLEEHIRPTVKPGTYANYRRNLTHHILPLLGDVPMDRLTSGQIQEAVELWQKRLAASTLRGVFRMLKAMLSAAAERGLLTHNPCQSIRLPKGKTRPPRVLTVSEQKRLEEAVRHSGNCEYLLCLYTGLRVGELCALRWADVDFAGRMLRVRHAAQRIHAKRAGRKTALVMATPKSESSQRDIPLPDFLMKMLKALKAESGDCAFVFKSAAGEMRDPRTMQQQLGRICKASGLQGVHMHTLRHSFATRCLEKGIRVEVLSALLGHSSPQITLKYYAHCTPEAKRHSMALLTRSA
ncbi:tyrosine-type recombinase/integrase [Bacillota bacterium Meth-B3]